MVTLLDDFTVILRPIQRPFLLSRTHIKYGSEYAEVNGTSERSAQPTYAKASVDKRADVRIRMSRFTKEILTSASS